LFFNQSNRFDYLAFPDVAIKAIPTISMVILAGKGRISKIIKIALANANKIPNINKILFIVIMFCYQIISIIHLSYQKTAQMAIL